MTLTIIVLTYNSQKVLPSCLQSLTHADEIIVVDDQSSDDTLKIAKKFTDKIYSHKLTTFPGQRNWAYKKASSDWFLFLDADERLTSAGFKEIKQLIKSTSHAAFRFKRLNYFYNKLIRHAGYWPDYQTRLFKRASFKEVKGVTHEQYLYTGTLGTLKHPVPHYPDRSVAHGLYKSIIWTSKEAQSLFKANHPPVTWWRLIKVMVWEFSFRYFKLAGFRDGYVGFVESFTQAINKFFIMLNARISRESNSKDIAHK